MAKDITINHDQRLYVIHTGNGYSCLGFEFAERRRKVVMAWARQTLTNSAVTPAALRALQPLLRLSDDPIPGTLEHFAEYERAMELGAKANAATGKRCEAELESALCGLEGKRVEVICPDGTKERFYVGKSTGWLPGHLAIKTRRSSGGCIAYIPAGATVRVVGTR